MMRRLLTLTLLVLLTRIQGHTELTVSLLTCEPGRDIYELEGHTAMRFKDDAQGLDIVVNWGIFDFNSPGFVYRFVKGETDYMAGATTTERFLGQYAAEGRGVSEQKLNLSEKEANALYELVNENLLPENRTYRYKYLTDNCATRPLALIERAIGKSIKPNTSHDERTSTWRNEMRRYHRNYPWYQFGIDLALGSRLDEKIGDRERTFAPVYLREYLIDSNISDKPVQFITETRAGAPADSTPWLLTPLAVALAVMVINATVCVLSVKHVKIPRGYISVFYLVAGLAGCIVTFLVFISTHEATAPNWVLLWLNPVCLLPAFGIWLKKLNRVIFYYQIANFASLTALLAIFAAGVQSPNPAFLPWIASDLMLAGSYLYIYRCQSKKTH